MLTSFPGPARSTDNADEIGNAVCRNKIFSLLSTDQWFAGKQIMGKASESKSGDVPICGLAIPYSFLKDRRGYSVLSFTDE
jgi:hypothetical protein